MSLHPRMTAALAEQHHRDLTGRVGMYRRARAAHGSHAAPARQAKSLMKIIQRTITARGTVLRLIPGLPKRISQPSDEASFW
jgi:hypothetical protein